MHIYGKLKTAYVLNLAAFCSFIFTFMCCFHISDNLSCCTLKCFVGHCKCADSARARPRCRRGYETHPLINSLVSVSVFVNTAKTSTVFLEEKNPLQAARESCYLPSREVIFRLQSPLRRDQWQFSPIRGFILFPPSFFSLF